MGRNPARVVHALLWLCTLPFTAAHGQVGPVGLELHGGLSVPTGDYAGDQGNDDGYADLGAVGLLNVYGGISTVPGLEWIVTAGVVAHGVQDELPKKYLEAGARQASAGLYWGIPVLGGLRYRAPVSDAASLHFEAQIGIHFLQGPTTEVDDLEITYDMASKFAFALGVGIDFNSRLGLGLRAVPLGEIETQAEYSDPDIEPVDVQQPVSYVDIYLAFRVR